MVRTLLLAATLALFIPHHSLALPIDRMALVRRHSPTLTNLDPHAPLMIGNGNLGFTADITGLQTFPEHYSALAPLLTMAQWAWHSFPNPNGYSEADGLVPVAMQGGGRQLYPWIRGWEELDRKPALQWLRENPHRFSLGRVALLLGKGAGRAQFADVDETRQTLDLWTGTLTSRFRYQNQPVTVETRVHPDSDAIMVSIRSALVRSGQIGIEVSYPGVSPRLNPDPSDWTRPSVHRTEVIGAATASLAIERRIDATQYYSSLVAPGAAITQSGPHQFQIRRTGSDRLDAIISFTRTPTAAPNPGPATDLTVARHWMTYWQSGGVVDFSGSTDPRATELERRVVLSQYLAAINQAGDFPPQEEGLFSNSWNGKFHLEMQPIHLAHWAQWGRPGLLERNLEWYRSALPRMREVAKRHGVAGAWWTKMAGPDGWNSPSTVNPFIMWQQPAPIHMAELLYRSDPRPQTLERYSELVEQTAQLLASWPRREGRRRVLGPPIIPVQENHPPLTTANPTFELEYFRWALTVAQQWRGRRGLPPNAEWERTIRTLARPALAGGLYLPTETAPDFWVKAQSKACSGNARARACLNRDHPSMLMAWGYIAGSVNREAMRRTLRAVERHWDLRQTWGWDFPIVAMTAARLGEPEVAVDWLFREFPNNQWGASGMTPRVHVEDEAILIGPAAGGRNIALDGRGLRRTAETYFPSNGSLLLAVGMMAAGWDGSAGSAPGFPKKGWKVRVEGIHPIP